MAEQQLSMGILIDIVDEEWMRDTLPDDGITSRSIHPAFPFSLRLILLESTDLSPCRSFLVLKLLLFVCVFRYPAAACNGRQDRRR